MSESTSYEIIEVSGLMHGDERALSWRDTIELKKEKNKKVLCETHFVYDLFQRSFRDRSTCYMYTNNIKIIILITFSLS